MATNAYLGRMNELSAKKEANTVKLFNLPSTAPLNKKAPGMAGNPAPEAPPTPDMGSPFGRKFTAYSQRDQNFTPMMQEYTALAAGLKEQVDRGFMPKVMAEKNLKQYIMDMRGYREEEANKPVEGGFDPQQFADNIRTVANTGMRQATGLDENGVPKALAGVMRVLKATEGARNGTV